MVMGMLFLGLRIVISSLYLLVDTNDPLVIYIAYFILDVYIISGCIKLYYFNKNSAVLLNP